MCCLCDGHTSCKMFHLPSHYEMFLSFQPSFLGYLSFYFLSNCEYQITLFYLSSGFLTCGTVFGCLFPSSLTQNPRLRCFCVAFWSSLVDSTMSPRATMCFTSTLLKLNLILTDKVCTAGNRNRLLILKDFCKTRSCTNTIVLGSGNYCDENAFNYGPDVLNKPMRPVHGPDCNLPGGSWML